MSKNIDYKELLIKNTIVNTIMKRKNNPEITIVDIKSKVGYETREDFVNDNKSYKVRLRLCASNTLNSEDLEKCLQEGVEILKKSIKEDYEDKEILKIEALNNPFEDAVRDDGISVYYIQATIKI